MLKVGVSEAVDAELFRLLPEGISLEVLPLQPERPTEVDFWIAPPWPKHCVQAWPWLRGVKVVQATLAGVDGLLRLLPSEVTLCDARGVHNIATAEWVVGIVLASLKYLPLYEDIRRAGIWKRRFEAQPLYSALHQDNRPLYPGVMVEELHGKRILIVGHGAIGQAIEDRLLPFGVQIDRVARTAREGVAAIGELPQLLPLADVVILIVPSTSETTGMIGAHELALMKQGALLVNAARGSVVDTDPLIAALHAGRIRAAIDVTDPEPLPDGHPLWSAPNLILTPHVAGSSPMFMVRAMQLAAQQVARYLRGEPLENVVHGEY
jgi:phosphoglycerate dehydrogenase-like enzyme